MTERAETIFALATPPGKAGVAVVRLSGPMSKEAVERLAGALGPARMMGLRKLRHGGELLDEALVVWFEENASFTGEQSAELHLHGGRAIVNGVTKALNEIDRLRPAEAGEFTRRALENGRLDLTQVEGLADLIDAQTEAQRRLAMGLVEGRLSTHVMELRAKALHVLALIEASIDFADEDDAPVDVREDVEHLLTEMIGTLERIMDGAEAAQSLRDGYRVALIGAPNSGKSTLINAIAGRDVAITSDIAGTTRDSIEVHCDVRGLPVIFVDTAGIRETDDQVEGIGVERALSIASSADLRILLETQDAPPPVMEVEREGDLRLWTKSDVYGRVRYPAVSAKTGDGVDDLLARIGDILEGRAMAAGSVARLRQLKRLQAAHGFFAAALREDGMECKSFEVRAALDALDEIVGLVNTETILGEIFSRFCMGK